MARTLALGLLCFGLLGHKELLGFWQQIRLIFAWNGEMVRENETQSEAS